MRVHLADLLLFLVLEASAVLRESVPAHLDFLELQQALLNFKIGSLQRLNVVLPLLDGLLEMKIEVREVEQRAMRLLDEPRVEVVLQEVLAELVARVQSVHAGEALAVEGLQIWVRTLPALSNAHGFLVALHL